MGSYLSRGTIREAVDRLGSSRAKSALTDYLVFKRALVIANENADAPVRAVVTGTQAPDFQAAIDELTSVAEGDDRPYYAPFGARRDQGRGYKSKKYPSNGPSDTASRWASRPSYPLEHVAGTSPKEFRPVKRSADELEGFLLIDGRNSDECSGEKPRLVDLAIWLHRERPLQENVLTDGAALVSYAKAALQLTADEIDGLFSDDTDDVQLATGDTAVAAVDYLPVPPTQAKKASVPTSSRAPTDVGEAEIQEVIGFVAAQGFVFHPWQVAAFITAARTKPFVILAGISGTGKTKLPRLVAEATGAHLRRIAVRPDWTDSSELLGYERLDGTFVPGELLQIAREAIENPTQHFFALLDEMNVARVEYYLAEVLSHIEERVKMPDGRLGSAPLAPAATDPEWASVHLPGNLCIVGSVNMDETTFGFSRKVLDRSFVIEFSTVSLSMINAIGETTQANPWNVEHWQPAALSLGEHPLRDHQDVGRAITALEMINQALTPVQMQVGFRVRDEVVMFVLGAQNCAESFVSEDEAVIDPLDLAISMKVLPRIQGSGVAVRTALERMREWADPESSGESTTGIATESFPFCADRIAMMLQRLEDTGFTSFWL